MTASELIEKIHNREIKSGTKIICHQKNEYFDYKITRWFMGNWFSKVPPEEHHTSDDFDRDFVLWLCNNSVTYEIGQNDIEKIDFKTVNTQKEKNKVMKDTINQLIDKVADLEKKIHN